MSNVQNSTKTPRFSKHDASVRYRPPVLKTRNGDLEKRWYVEYHVWDETNAPGQLVRQVKYCPVEHKTAAQRKRWGNELVAGINRLFLEGFYKLTPKPKPVPVPERAKPRIAPEIITVKQALQLIVEVKESTLRKRSGESYLNAFRRFCDYLAHYEQANLLLSQLAARHLYEFSDYIILHRNGSSRYRNNLIGELRTMFDELIGREYIAKNPAGKIKELPVQTSRKNIAYTQLQREEFELFLRDYNPALYAYTRFIYQGFIRPVELMRLQVRDIELEANRIVFHPSVGKGGSRKQYTEYVEITPALRPVIEGMNLDRNPTTHYVFSTKLLPGTKAVERNRVSELHHDALVAAGMYNGELTMYSWKHTGVMNAYKAGASIAWLQKHLRHSDLKDTCVYLKSLGLMLEEKSVAPSW